ncbi:MAG: thiolase family protein [Magnetospirillum sp.]|nr:thiolase family protein [Magnetospirillum sp.]
MAYLAEIPYGCYWTTPFARWQGSFSHLHSLEFAAHVARRELARRDLPASAFDYGVLGVSVPQKHAFYGLPWLMGMIGAEHVGGPTLSQACATSVRCLLASAQEIESGLAQTALALTCDRTSNGPHIYYPAPAAPGGIGDSEDWVMQNFSFDPYSRKSMLVTAENCAAEHKIDTARQHEIVLRRQEQYDEATADDCRFLRRYMTLPFEVPSANYKKVAATLAGDEGIVRSTAEGLARLKPVAPDGTVTYGGHTHPADGNAGIVVAAPGPARDMSKNPAIRIRLLGFGLDRVQPAWMPKATVPAARRALAQAGLAIGQIDAVKVHNPFVVNDIVFAAEMGIDVMTMNNFGSSLIWGHPQAPMGSRAVIELIEELAARGGGYGLFSGCAAGDSAMAVVIRVGDA